MEYGQKPATIMQYILALDYSTRILGINLILLILGCVTFQWRDDLQSFYAALTRQREYPPPRR